MEKKKILMVCEAFGGGVFTYVSQLCNDIAEEFEVYLAYALRPQTPENYKEYLSDKVHLIEMKHLKNCMKSAPNIIAAIKELHHIENEIKPDLIHLHSSIAGGIGRLAYRGKKYAVVYTPHGYAHILMGAGIKSFFYEKIEKILGKTNCITLTCCESEDEIAKTLCKNTMYIETGINLEDLSRALCDICPENHNKFTVFTLGRVCFQKQPQLFNEIATLVPEARFVWIGSGELENLLTSPNIQVTGWKPRKGALSIAKGADVFILCSLGEAIAMSLIENMFIKKLVLVSNVMGNKSVIKDGINGYICNTAQDYANKIKEAMKKFPVELTENAYRDVMEIYNTKVMTKKYIEFYNRCIERL